MRWLAQRYVKLRGWEFVGSAPPFAKFVAVGAPHTSNWDFVFFLAVVSRLGIPGRAVGKIALVRWPFGTLMRRLGIIPLDRDSGQGLVGQMVDEFAATDEIALVVAPEGTRRRANYWRSGFYHIAIAANVPIVLTFIDFKTKQTGIGPTIQPTGDVRRDMEKIREFYSGITGRHPENQGPILLREEL
ncbi:MAG: glycerol acyltransferase [bacterium]|nr:glycerol acyltransferase [bacterium]